MRAWLPWIAGCLVACTGTDSGGDAPGGGGMGSSMAGAGAGAAAGAGGVSGAAGASFTGGGSGGMAGVGGAGAGGMASGGSGAVGGDGGGGMASQPPPASCGEAARAYTVGVSTMLDASFVVAEAARSWGGGLPRTPVAVDAASGAVYVGFTRAQGAVLSVVIAAENGMPADAVEIPDATIGGVAVTSDGVAALVFDPNTNVDERVWTAVARYTADGTEVFKTAFFHSPNLADVGTKGAPTTARFGYRADSDELVAYFGHTQRYDDDVRHQGGYLATLDASGEQDLIEGWFGSHNLDQRLLIDGSRVAVLGLGDAFPKGIFFSYIDDARTNVVYSLAADGVGTTNGQLGGMIDFADPIIAPFITNRSVAQDLDAGAWPDTDEMISMQIRDAAAVGTDLGLLSVPKEPLPDGDLEPVWLEAQVASGARMESLKSAKYGTGELILLAWAEVTGSQRNETSTYYTMVVDSDGAVCQPKTQLDQAYAFTPGDDLVARDDGSIVWANVQAERVQVLTLTP